MGLSGEEALWMTPREMSAAAEGYGRHLRTQVVLDPRTDFDERRARKFIEGNGSPKLSPEEKQRKLNQLKNRIEGDADSR